MIMQVALSEPASEGRVFTFAEAAPDITQIQVGDAVEGFGDLNEYDALVISLARVSLTHPLTDEGAFRQPPAGPIPVRRHQGLNSRGVPKYAHWLPHAPLPSTKLKPAGFIGSIVNSRVTVIERGECLLDEDTSAPGVSLLLTADLEARSKRIEARSAKLLTVTAGNRGRWSASYEEMPDNSADLSVKLVRAASCRTARRQISHNVQNPILVGRVAGEIH